MKPQADEELHRLFAAYAHAFDAFDAAGIAAFYHLPCLMVRASSVALFTTCDALQKNMEDLLAMHRLQDFGTAEFADLHVVDLEDALAIVAVTWTIHTRAHAVLWQFGTTYNLLRTTDGWKILVATTHTAAHS